MAEKVFSALGTSVSYKVGTMIEIPRAALVADEVRENATRIFIYVKCYGSLFNFYSYFYLCASIDRLQSMPSSSPLGQMILLR